MVRNILRVGLNQSLTEYREANILRVGLNQSLTEYSKMQYNCHVHQEDKE